MKINVTSNSSSYKALFRKSYISGVYLNILINAKTGVAAYIE